MCCLYLQAFDESWFSPKNISFLLFLSGKRRRNSVYCKTIRKRCQHYLSSKLPLPPPLKVAQFSFITFNMFRHKCLPVFRSLPRFDSPARLLFFPILIVLLADFKIPEGNTSNTPTLSSTTSIFITIHLSSTENWFHGFTLDRIIASNCYLKSQSQISHYLLIYVHIPGFLSPTKPLALTCEDLNSLDPTTSSYSPQGLLTFVLVLPKLDFTVGSEMTRLPALSIPWLLYPFSPLFWFWFPRRGLWGIECQSFTQEVILGSVKTWGSETKKGRKPLQDLLRSGLPLWLIRVQFTCAALGSCEQELSEWPSRQRQGTYRYWSSGMHRPWAEGCSQGNVFPRTSCLPFVGGPGLLLQLEKALRQRVSAAGVKKLSACTGKVSAKTIWVGQGWHLSTVQSSQYWVDPKCCLLILDCTFMLLWIYDLWSHQAP